MIHPKPITLVIAEDHTVVRQGLCALFKLNGGFIILGEAHNGREVVRLAETLKPDIVIMDLVMPLLNGIEATRQIRAANPAAKVVILSAHGEEEYVRRVMELGVMGFLVKQTSAKTLTKALREVAQGKPHFSPSITKHLEQSLGGPPHRQRVAKMKANRLTPRETEVLQLVAEGHANKQAAHELKISVKTVEKHRNNLMRKLRIHETAGLTRYAIASGIIHCPVELTIT